MEILEKINSFRDIVNVRVFFSEELSVKWYDMKILEKINSLVSFWTCWWRRRAMIQNTKSNRYVSVSCVTRCSPMYTTKLQTHTRRAWIPAKVIEVGRGATKEWAHPVPHAKPPSQSSGKTNLKRKQISATILRVRRGDPDELASPALHEAPVMSIFLSIKWDGTGQGRVKISNCLPKTRARINWKDRTLTWLVEKY